MSSDILSYCMLYQTIVLLQVKSSSRGKLFYPAFSLLFPVGSRAERVKTTPTRLLYDHLKISKNVSAPQRYLGPLHGAEKQIKKVRNTKYLP